MIVGHALATLAVVTLIGEAARIQGWARDLEACRERPDGDRAGWPFAALDDARARLYKRHATAEFRAEIAATADLLLVRQQWTWRLGQMVAFLVPGVGFAMGLWNLRIEGNTIPWREVAMPLLLGLAEAIPPLLLALWVRGAAVEALKEWSRFAEEVAVGQPLDGLRDDPSGEDEADGPESEPTPAPASQWDSGWGGKPAAPAPPVKGPPPPAGGARKDQPAAPEPETKRDETRWY